MKRCLSTFVVLVTTIIVAGCGAETGSDEAIIGGADGPTSVYLASKSNMDSYTQIDQEMAKAMMELDDGHIVVDVRRQDEYDIGHIPGAICIPNESINEERLAGLPDYNQIILV